MCRWSIILHHTVILRVVLISASIISHVHVIHPIINLVIDVVNVIYTFVRVLLVTTFIALLYFCTLLLPLIFSIGSDPFALEHAAVATSRACLL
jgi:hypothetical protein